MKKFLTYSFLIRVGLACVFLTNSIVAFFSPDEFQELISGSFIAKILPISVASFITFIGINDLVVAVLLSFGWRTSRVAIWASLWIIGVIFVIGVFSLDALEHLAFLFMAIALTVPRRTEVV